MKTERSQRGCHAGSKFRLLIPTCRALVCCASFVLSIFQVSVSAQLLQGMEKVETSSSSLINEIEEIILPGDDIEATYEPEWVEPTKTKGTLVTDPETGDVFFTLTEVTDDTQKGQTEHLAPKGQIGVIASPSVSDAYSQTNSRNHPASKHKANPESGSLLFADLTNYAVPLTQRQIPAKPTNAVSFTLSPVERSRARAAWAYIENNRDATTGFVRSVDYKDASGGHGGLSPGTVSAKDVGLTFAALESARTLGLISKPEYDFQTRRLIASTAKIERYMGLPTYRFDVSTGLKAVNSRFGVQVEDLAYLMAWLTAVKRNAPYLGNAVDDLVASWSFCHVIDPNGQLQSLIGLSESEPYKVPLRGLGQRGFVEKAFSLWGFRAHATPSVEPYDTRANTISYNGVGLISGSDRLLHTEPFLQDGLLFDWDLVRDLSSDTQVYTDGWRAEMAHRIYQAQLERYKATGIITARGSHYSVNGQKEATYVSQPLVDSGLSFSNKGLDGLNNKHLNALSTKSAFAIWALWETPYTGLLFEAVGDSFDTERGFPEGFDEGRGGMIPIYSLETNATVLLSLAYNHQGALIPKRDISREDLWHKSRAKPVLQASRCLPPVYKPLLNPVHACGAHAPVENFDYQQCTTVGSAQYDCTTCQQPQAVTNCSFFEREDQPVSNQFGFDENPDLHACGPKVQF